jgi:hypothetical protein
MTPADMRELVAARLPERYDHLKLTFYGKESRLHGEHVIIGHDYATDLCARLDDGSIYAIDPKERYPTRFMNSGVEQLARFIEVSESFSGTKLDSEALAQQMREALQAVDPRAFTESPNWWGELLEGFAFGL